MLFVIVIVLCLFVLCKCLHIYLIIITDVQILFAPPPPCFRAALLKPFDHFIENSTVLIHQCLDVSLSLSFLLWAINCSVIGTFQGVISNGFYPTFLSLPQDPCSRTATPPISLWLVLPLPAYKQSRVNVPLEIEWRSMSLR